MSTALDNSGHNCDLPLQAESLVMAKEHVVKAYGTLRYTIGTGCSGGSLAQQWIANAYPGVYQGILPTCSFPDAWSTASAVPGLPRAARVLHATRRSGRRGVAWLPTQMGDVLGGPDGVAERGGLRSRAVPRRRPDRSVQRHHGRQPVQRDNQPGRDSLHDHRRRDQRASAPSRRRSGLRPSRRSVAASRGEPVDNVGVQYGLKALTRRNRSRPRSSSTSTPNVGGADVDANLTPARIDATGAPSLARAYRSGMINETNNLNQTAIIDCRGPNPGLVPRRLSGVRCPRAPRPRARHPRQPADLGGPDHDRRRQRTVS